MSYASRTTPLSLLIYYGWPSSFNSASNGWDINKVAMDMGRYGLIVLGSGLEETSHGDHDNTVAIIAHLLTLDPNARIFGYEDTAQAFDAFADKVAKWEAMGATGIFLDKAGYDYGTVATNGRAAFNAKVDLLHSLGLMAFANAWKLDHVLTEEDDASYPNATWNPYLLKSNLRPCADWCLLESLAVNDDSYTNGFEAQSQFLARAGRARALRGQALMAAVGIIGAEDTGKFAFLWTAGLMALMDAVGNADTGYGASTATTRWYVRPADWPWGDYLDHTPIAEVPGVSTSVCRQLAEGTVRFTLAWGSTPPASTIDRL
jgi:hypothetical protein